MKRFTPVLIACLLVLITVPALAESPSVEDILARYAEARGGSELAEAKTLKLTGSFNFNGIDSSYTVYRQRPDRFRVEIETSRGTVITAFDGENAWSRGPDRSGEIQTREMEGDDRQRFLDENVDFDGPLIDSAKKGHRVELIGETDVDGEAVYHLKVILESGNVQQWYLSTDSGLPVHKITPAVHRRAGPYDRIWYLMEYETASGIALPFYVEREDRQHVRAYTLEKVEVDVEIDPALFEMPGAPAGGS